jgi:hypothetical protein
MKDESLTQAAADCAKDLCDKLGRYERAHGSGNDFTTAFLKDAFEAGAKHMSREVEALVAALENLNKQTFGQAHAWAGTWTKCECSRVWAFGGNWNECQPAGLCPWCTATKALARFKAARGEHE